MRARLLSSALLCSSVIAAPALANGRFPKSQRLLEDPRDPSHLYLTATFGLLETADGGQNWYHLCEQAFAFAVDEGDPLLEVLPDGTVLSGIIRRINRSPDCGCTWNTVLGTDDNVVWDIAQDRLQPGRVVALYSDNTVAPAEHYVYVSSDGGATWQPLSVLPTEVIQPLTIDVAPSNSSRIYVSATLEGSVGALLVSDNAGSTWSSRSIPGASLSALPYIAAVHPSDADYVFVRTDEWVEGELASDALHVTQNAGAGWTEVVRKAGKMYGFALAPDLSTVLVGYGDPVTGGGRLTYPEELGIYRASLADFTFEHVFSAAVSCLAWTDAGLYACNEQFYGDLPERGFALGFRPDANFTLADADPFSPRLNLSDVRGPMGCNADVCGAAWLMAGEDGTPAACSRLDATCEIDPGAALACSVGSGGGGSAGAAGATGSGGGTSAGTGGALGGSAGTQPSGGASGGSNTGGNRSDSGDEGCGCRVAGGRQRSGAAGVLLVAGLGLLRRRGVARLLCGLLAALALAGCSGGEDDVRDDPIFKTPCEGRGDAFSAGMTKSAEDGTVVVSLESADPAPPANSADNVWTLRVTNAAGELVEHAELIAAPYMVDHGHGAPNQLASEIEPGLYSVSSLALQMSGLWEVTIRVVPEDGGPESRVLFSFCIES